MSKQKKFVPVLICLIVFSCFKKSEGLRKDDMQSLINYVLSRHVQYDTIDDEISRRIFRNYISALDYGKYYFYQSDIDEFKKNEELFDDYIAIDDYSAVYEIFKVYKKRVKEASALFDELVKGDFDFKKDETIVVDRDNVPFAKNSSQLKERWRKNVKLQLLNYLSSGKKIKDAKKKLIKKYDLVAKRVDEIDESRLLSMFMNSVTASLDPHTNYLTQDDLEDFQISMQLKLEGIGVRLRSEDGFVIVESIIAGGATDKLPDDIRLKPEDRIISVSQNGEEPVDVIDMDLRDVVKHIRGKKGTTVKLTVIRKSSNGGKDQRMIVPIVREEIKLQDSDAESEIHTIKRHGKTCKIGYIKLPSFYVDDETGKSSSGDVEKELKELKKKKVNVVVLDLRGNPGGALNEAIRLMGLFIETGPVLQVKGKHQRASVYSDTDPSIVYRGPLVVLIDKFSASASEIMAGAVRDYGRGLIIGPSSTFGKGSVQNLIPLGNDMGAIKISISIFYQPGGTSNQLGGIAPHIVVPSLSSIWNIGEVKTKYPLKWKKIKSAKFRKTQDVNSKLIAKLKSESFERTNGTEYVKLREKIKKYKAKIMEKTISLKDESDINRQKEKELTKKMREDRKRKGIDIKKDLFMKEVFNITGDYFYYNK